MTDPGLGYLLLFYSNEWCSFIKIVFVKAILDFIFKKESQYFEKLNKPEDITI
jgi:hypothetical protein